jgi:hypothetical protein
MVDFVGIVGCMVRCMETCGRGICVLLAACAIKPDWSRQEMPGAAG